MVEQDQESLEAGVDDNDLLPPSKTSNTLSQLRALVQTTAGHETCPVSEATLWSTVPPYLDCFSTSMQDLSELEREAGKGHRLSFGLEAGVEDKIERAHVNHAP